MGNGKVINMAFNNRQRLENEKAILQKRLEMIDLEAERKKDDIDKEDAIAKKAKVDADATLDKQHINNRIAEINVLLG